MPKKTFTPAQIVAKLRQIEVLVNRGKTVPLACTEAGTVALDAWGCAAGAAIGRKKLFEENLDWASAIARNAHRKVV